MHTVIVRVWLPDRPGALALVAGRIGAAEGDLIDIEVLESGGGRVIDELVVSLPSVELVDPMVEAIHGLDEVSVEHVRPAPAAHTDGGLIALAMAAELAETAAEERLSVLVAAVGRLVDADWVILVAGTDVVGSAGEPPEAEWVSSLVAGSQHLDGPQATMSSMFWADLPLAGMWLAAGREERGVHDRERVRLDLLARVADALLL